MKGTYIFGFLCCIAILLMVCSEKPSSIDTIYTIKVVYWHYPTQILIVQGNNEDNFEIMNNRSEDYELKIGHFPSTLSTVSTGVKSFELLKKEPFCK